MEQILKKNLKNLGKKADLGEQHCVIFLVEIVEIFHYTD